MALDAFNDCDNIRATAFYFEVDWEKAVWGSFDVI